MLTSTWWQSSQKIKKSEQRSCSSFDQQLQIGAPHIHTYHKSCGNNRYKRIQVEQVDKNKTYKVSLT